ncbi:hypothetical protein V6N13_032916 [Hibiscus sabdariffa]
MLLCSSDLGHCPTVFITPLCSLPPVSMGVPSHPEVIRNTDFMLNKVGLGNREIVGLRTKKQQLTCNREMRQIGMKKPQFTFVMKMQQRDETDWNEEATIHICDENVSDSYFLGKKAPYTGVVVFDGGQRNDSTFLAFQTTEESDNMHHDLLCCSDNNSLLYHHRLHYKDKDKDEWLIAVEASQTVYSYFDYMRVKWRPSKRFSRFAQRSEWFKHIKDDFEAIF